MTHKELEVLIRGLAPAVKQYVGEQIAPLEAEVKKLTQQVRELETKSMTYAGVWEPGTYAGGSVVTRSGSAWHTTRATCGTPGGPESADRDWTLIVKHGRDGRDGR